MTHQLDYLSEAERDQIIAAQRALGFQKTHTDRLPGWEPGDPTTTGRLTFEEAEGPLVVSAETVRKRKALESGKVKLEAMYGAAGLTAEEIAVRL